MFADAYEKVSKFTHPLITSTRTWDGTVSCGVGAFVIVNADGWIITAAHLLQPHAAFQQHQKEIQSYKRDLDQIENDPNTSAKQKSRRRKKLRRNPEWITNHSPWWGIDNVKVPSFRVFPELDLAVGRLEPFDSGMIEAFPVFKDHDKLRPGTSLCKLGFPFHNLSATFDESTGNFTLAPGSVPVPRFPIEGIYTRNISMGPTNDGKFNRLFIETSTPGLRGQSGGPVFDREGVVYGIQSQTRHFPLGFNPTIEDKKRKRQVEENQFLNAGMAVHPETIRAVLDDTDIAYGVSTD